MIENFVSVFIRAHLKAFLSSLSSASSNLGQENLDLRDGRLLLQDVALSPTIVFEHPRARAIAAHLLEHVSDADLQSAVPAATRVPLRSDLQRACDASIGKVAVLHWEAEAACAYDGGFVGGVQCCDARACGREHRRHRPTPLARARC